MVVYPNIVSFWSGEASSGFLCSGLLLDPFHVLTVSHAFRDFGVGSQTNVGLVPGKSRPEPAMLVARHDTLDAAIFRLTASADSCAPIRLAEVPKDYRGQRGTGHVVDPDSHNVSRPATYTVGTDDAHTHELIVTPQSAIGYSGGVLEVGGTLVGLFNRRVEGDPLCRVVSMAELRPWIMWVLGAQADEADVGENYLRVARLLGFEVRRRLANEGTRQLYEAGGFPGDVDDLEAAPPSDRFQRLMVAFYEATSRCADSWKNTGERYLHAIRQDCQIILGELIKLAVTADYAEGDLCEVVAHVPERMFTAARRTASAAAAYCALTDQPLTLTQRKQGDVDVGGGNVVDMGSLAMGVGDDAERDAFEAVWRATKGAPVPKEFNADTVENLQDFIAMNHDEYGQPAPFLVVAGPKSWLHDGGLAQASTMLQIGLVVRDSSCECKLLVLKESRLVNHVCKYLSLLESL